MALAEQTEERCFDLKGSRLMVMVLHLYDTNRQRLTEQLTEKCAQAPNLFKDAPVILDLSGLLYKKPPQTFKFLVELLAELGMLPVGVRGGNRKLQSLAMAAGLGVLPEVPQERQRDTVTEPKVAPAEEVPAPIESAPVAPLAPRVVKAKVVTQPVRSGQQIVAQGDLILLSTVSPGAEVLAEGCIHVYGALRGRALAGISGDENARIFCQSMEAELVSVAGQYQINEALDPAWKNKAVQIYLDKEHLIIEPLGKSSG